MRSLRLNEQRVSFTINWQLFPTSDVNGLPSAFWGTDSLQLRYKKLQTAELPWAMVSCWGAWENQGEAVWEDSSSACPRDDITIILLFLSRLEITSKPAKSYCKSLLWEPKKTKDMNIATLVFPFLFIPKVTRVLPREFKILFTKIDYSSVKENNL